MALFPLWHLLEEAYRIPFPSVFCGFRPCVYPWWILRGLLCICLEPWQPLSSAPSCSVEIPFLSSLLSLILDLLLSLWKVQLSIAEHPKSDCGCLLLSIAFSHQLDNL